MKFTAYFSLLAAMLLVSCHSGKLVFESDFDYRGRFNEYRTFSFLNIQNVPMAQDQEQIIQKTIYTRFTAMGYVYDASKSDILISYRFFQDPVEVNGFNQHSLQTWLSQHKHLQYEMISEKDKEYLRKRVMLPAQSYMVYILDSSNSKVIWQGYTGQLEPWAHEQQLVASIGRVLDEYKVTAYDLKGIKN